MMMGDLDKLYLEMSTNSHFLEDFGVKSYEIFFVALKVFMDKS